MNTSHYPSLELCKKLTEIGFPETERDWLNDGCYENGSEKYAWISKDSDEKDEWVRLQCPSVMELLDEMPKFITTYKKADGTYQVRITPGKKNFVGTLPNALAEMYLWLKENNYL